MKEQNLTTKASGNDVNSVLARVINSEIKDKYYCDSCDCLSDTDPCEECETEELWPLKDILEDEINQPGTHNIKAIVDAVDSYYAR